MRTFCPKGESGSDWWPRSAHQGRAKGVSSVADAPKRRRHRVVNTTREVAASTSAWLPVFEVAEKESTHLQSPNKMEHELCSPVELRKKKKRKEKTD